MKSVLRSILILAVLGVCFWLYTLLFPSAEKVVLKRIASLAATATITRGEGPLSRANKVSNLIGYFATDAEIAYDVNGVGARTLSGRDEIREAAAGGFVGLASLTVRFQDATVRVGPDRQNAEVSCTANVSANDEPNSGIQELHFTLRKMEGQWLITHAETVKTLR